MNTESPILPVFSLNSSAPETLGAEYHEVLKKIDELQKALGKATLNARDFPDDGYAWDKAREERTEIFDLTHRIHSYASAWVEHSLDAWFSTSTAA